MVWSEAEGVWVMGYKQWAGLREWLAFHGCKIHWTTSTVICFSVGIEHEKGFTEGALRWCYCGPGVLNLVMHETPCSFETMKQELALACDILDAATRCNASITRSSAG